MKQKLMIGDNRLSPSAQPSEQPSEQPSAAAPSPPPASPSAVIISDGVASPLSLSDLVAAVTSEDGAGSPTSLSDPVNEDDWLFKQKQETAHVAVPSPRGPHLHRSMLRRLSDELSGRAEVEASPLLDLAKDAAATSRDFVTLARKLGSGCLSEFDIVKGKEIAPALHQAMRHTAMTFDEEQLNELLAIDADVLTRGDKDGATPLHLYLRHTNDPSSEFVRLLHHKMEAGGEVKTNLEQVVTALYKGEMARPGRGLACRNSWGFTPVMDLFENPCLFSSATSTSEGVLDTIRTIAELDPIAFERVNDDDGFTACHYLFSRAKLSPALIHTIMECDPVALQRRTADSDVPRTPAQLLLSNENETMDVFLRLAPVYHGLMEQVVTALYKGEMARPGLPGQMLEPLVRRGAEPHAVELLVRRIISFKLFTSEAATTTMANDDSEDEGGESEEHEFVIALSDSFPLKDQTHDRVRGKAGLQEAAHKEWTRLAHAVREGPRKRKVSRNDFKNVAKFMLMLVPLKDPKKFHGWVPGKGIVMMAKVFDAVQAAIAHTSAMSTEPEFGSREMLRLKVREEAWLEACVDVVAYMVADPQLIHGMLLHAPPAHTLELIGSSALLKVVIDRKYMAGPIYAFYIEFALYTVLLYAATLNLSLWSEPKRWIVGSITFCAAYFTFRMVEHMLVMRGQELKSVPTKLGFDRDRVAINHATPFKILFLERYRSKFLQGNDGTNKSHYFDKKNLGDLVGLFLTTFLGLSKSWRKDWWNLATFLGLGATWILLWQVLTKGVGDRMWGVVTGFFLWLEFFRRLKGTSIEMATFVLMLQKIIVEVDMFMAMFALVMVMFGSLFRIALHHKHADEEDADDEEEEEDQFRHFATSMWIVFLAALGEFQDEQDPGSLYPTTAMKVLFVLMTFICWIILMNVLIAIISESFSEAVTNSEKIFYGARIDLLHQLGNGVKALNQVCPAWVQRWMKQSMDEEELKVELAPIVFEAIKGPIHYSEKTEKPSRYSDLSKRLRDEVRRSASHTVHNVKQVQDTFFAEVKEDIKELRELIGQLRDDHRRALSKRAS